MEGITLATTGGRGGRWSSRVFETVSQIHRRVPSRVHRQNVEVTNAEWTKRRMGQNAECQNVE